MSAYFFVDIRQIKDVAKMDEYRSRVASTVEKFGGRYLVRGGPFEVDLSASEAGDARISKYGSGTAVV